MIPCTAVVRSMLHSGRATSGILDVCLGCMVDLTLSNYFFKRQEEIILIQLKEV
jgi:hypothetical protein